MDGIAAAASRYDTPDKTETGFRSLPDIRVRPILRIYIKREVAMLSRRSLAALALVPVMPAVGVAAVPRDPVGGACRNATTWRRLGDDNAADFCPTELEVMVMVPRTVASMRRLIDDQVALWGEPDLDDPWGVVVMQLRAGLERMVDRR